MAAELQGRGNFRLSEAGQKEASNEMNTNRNVRVTFSFVVSNPVLEEFANSHLGSKTMELLIHPDYNESCETKVLPLDMSVIVFPSLERLNVESQPIDIIDFDYECVPRLKVISIGEPVTGEIASLYLFLICRFAPSLNPSQSALPTRILQIFASISPN